MYSMIALRLGHRILAHGSRRARVVLGLVAGLTLLQGCQLFGGARIDELAIGTGKPSNVAAFVSVTRKGKPVAGLPASAFQLEENSQPINAETSQLQLVDATHHAAFHAVLLVDISESSQPEARRLVSKAAAAFVRRARRGQTVTVVAYDGSDKVKVVGEYPVDPRADAPEMVDALISLVPADPSRNLRGAVAQGIDILNERLESSGNTVRLGTLTVFTRGPDLAGRFSKKELDKALSENTHKLVAIDVTGSTLDDTSDLVSENGFIHAQSADTIPIAFEEAATLVDGLREQYYLISYCSPSRAGVRKLTVTVSIPDSDGKDDKESFSAPFDATGFSAACDPQKVPPLIPKIPPAPSKTKRPPTPPPTPPPAAEPETPSPTVTPPKTSVAKPLVPPSSNPKKSGSTVTRPIDEEAPVPAKPGYAQ